jgi:predicted dehydrogenase
VSATVAVVGRGFGAAVHAPGWELAGAKVVAVAGRDDWRDAIEGADIVSVATPPAAHAEVANAAQGKRILCEKPLAATTAEAEAMVAAATAPTAVNFSYRALPEFRTFRELVDPADVRVRWTTPSRLRPAQPSWRDDPTQGGALAAYGIHALDYLVWMLGPARVESAQVEGNDDAFTAVLRHERGRSTVTVSLVETERVHRLEAGDLVLENVHPRDPVTAFALRHGREVVAVERLRATAGDYRVAPFAVHARALLDDTERPTFTDGLHAQRLLDEIRRAGS